MLACTDCRNLMLDYLYGLLDAAESATLRGHLSGCAACRAALTASEAQQRMLGQAAQVYAHVPPFQAPAAETAVTAAAPTPAPATLPMPARSRRAVRRWLGGAVAAAAAVVLAVWAWQQYDAGLRRHEADLARLRKEAVGVEDRYVQLCKLFEEQQEQAPALVRRQFTRLQVLGPGDYQAGAANTYHVVTEDVQHQPRPARVTVRLLRPADQKELYAREYLSPGEVDVVVPADAPLPQDGPPLLVIEARTAAGRSEEVRQVLPVVKPAHVTHVVLNRTVIYPGEELFFRTLTLERYGLRPPADADQEWALDIQLLGPGGMVERRIARATSQGIVSDSFKLRTTLPPGTYTLRVGPAEAPKAGRTLATVQRQLTVLRPEQPQILVERGQYGPDEQVKGMVFGGYKAGEPTAGKSVRIEASVGGKPVDVNGQKQAQVKTDATGRAPFELKMPRVTTETDAVLKATFDDKEKGEVQQTVKLMPGPVDVKLFPEGGDLVPGVVNRIYYHALTPEGTPAQVEGKLFDRAGTELGRFGGGGGMGGFSGDGKLGLGSFQITPPGKKAADPLAKKAEEKQTEAGSAEVYRLVVTSPQGVAVREEQLSVQTDGVALQADEPVTREGQPLSVRLRDPEHGRPLLVAAVCRGRLVAQQYVVVPDGGATVRLTPAPGVRGVLRLTVYGVEAKGLRPLAERLVYCQPAAPLRLTVADLNDAPKDGFKPGQDVALKVSAGEAKEATVLAAVVDERWERAMTVRGVGSPEAYFYLATELEQPEALDDAEVLLGDGPQAERALDLFLGTRGWRRFPDAGPTAELTLLTADNGDRVDAALQAAVAEQRRQLWEETEHGRAVLLEERRRRALAAQDAAEALAEYQALPRRWGALAAVAAIAVLFVAFVLGVAAALVQTLRGRPLPRVALGGACVALLLAVAVHFATEAVRGGDRRDTPQVADALLRHQWSELQRPEAPALRPAKADAPTQVMRSVTRARREKDDKDQAVKDTKLPSGGSPPPGFDAQLRMQQRSTLMAMNNIHEPKAPNISTAGGKGGKKGDAGKSKSVAPQPMMPEGAAKKDGKNEWEVPREAGTQAPRQYTYARQEPVPGLLLWQPALTLTDGSAVVRFPLPPTPGVYRVLLYGNTPDGRLGFSQHRLETRK